jgi:tetratricopeptide (TPR) repeat protein
LFARLAVFAGGWTLEAAEAISGADLDTLASLVDKSLVSRGESGRFSMLETIREYALERFEERGDLDSLRSAHAQHFLALAEAAEPQFSGPDQVEWLALLEAEHENLRAALGWTLADGGEAERASLGLRLAGALGRLWYVHTHVVEGCTWLERALAVNPGEAETRAKALHALGILTDERGDLTRAAELFAESLGLYRASGDQIGLARSLNSLGIVARNQGDTARARQLLAESLELRRNLGDLGGISATTSNLGIVAVDEGNHGQARALFEESLAIDRERNDATGIAINLSNLGVVTLEQGDAAAARDYLAAGMRAYVELGDREGVATSLAEIAAFAIKNTRPVHAVRLFGAAAALREALGTPLTEGDRAGIERDLARASGELGEQKFADAFAEGRELSLEEAVSDALAEVEENATSACPDFPSESPRNLMFKPDS